MMLHQYYNGFFDMLDSAAKSVGLNHVEWSIVARRDNTLAFSVVGYIHEGTTHHIITSGPDMATVIQRAQGKLREVALAIQEAKNAGT